MNAALGIMVAVLVFSSPVAAQMAGLGAGARVRVTSPRDDLKRHVGTIGDVRGDSIVVGFRGSSRTIALANVTALEISTGRRRQVFRDAALGLGIGALTGAALGAVTYKEPDFFINSAATAAAAGGILLGTVGLVAGGLVGLEHRTDRWEPVRLPGRATIAPTRSGGISLGFSKAF